MNALTLPDIATQASHETLALDWVGMCGIALPISIDNQRGSAKVDAGVSLDDVSARGIHMSRLYLGLERLEQEELTALSIREVLEGFLENHEGLSRSAYHAARRLGAALQVNVAVVGFKVRVVHAESLHAHDAVAEINRNWSNSSVSGL